MYMDLFCSSTWRVKQEQDQEGKILHLSSHSLKTHGRKRESKGGEAATLYSSFQDLRPLISVSSLNDIGDLLEYFYSRLYNLITDFY